MGPGSYNHDNDDYGANNLLPFPKLEYASLIIVRIFIDIGFDDDSHVDDGLNNLLPFSKVEDLKLI